ncbi:MAG TPA: hypothetical protein VEO54_10725 [Thermoanaerobaculia bacterium]|nr:hypothetical protein [Thermoanaerobaculia bacterium]
MTDTASILQHRGTFETLAGGRVKGVMVRAHMDWVRQYHGEEALGRVLRGLPPPIWHELDTAVATTWCSFDSLIAFDAALQERFGRGRNLMIELGRYSAFRNLSVTYRFFRRSGVHDFFRRSSVLHSQFQDFGRVEYQRLGTASCELRHVAARCFSPLYCASAIGYYQQAAVMHGAASVTIEEVLCQCTGGEACVFLVQWE